MKEGGGVGWGVGGWTCVEDWRLGSRFRGRLWIGRKGMLKEGYLVLVFSHFVVDAQTAHDSCILGIAV